MKKIAMRNLCMFLVVGLISCVGLYAQSLQDKKAVTHFYMVNLDEDLYNVFTPAKNGDNSSNYIADEVVASIVDTFYTIASEKFRIELGLELLPLNELKSKIKYNNQFPNCPDMANIKKVLKSASGYTFYADYFVNIFSDISTTIPVRALPNKIKPLYAISFTLYDAKGKTVEKIDFSYKSRKSLTESAKVDLSKSSQQLKSKLCDLYSEALEGFYIVCRKKLTAQL